MRDSQPARNPELDAFSRVASWYFANPPATWCIARRFSSWHVTARDGTYISSHPSRADAAANLTDGPCAAAHYATLDWYLGYSHDQRPLTAAERTAVELILSAGRSPGRGSGSISAELHVPATVSAVGTADRIKVWALRPWRQWREHSQRQTISTRSPQQ